MSNEDNHMGRAEQSVTEITCPECRMTFSLEDRAGLPVESFLDKGRWIVPMHHEPDSNLFCDGSGQIADEQGGAAC